MNGRLDISLDEILLVVDIDGVVADSRAREAAALEIDPTKGKAFWAAFFDPEKLHLDTPILGAAALTDNFRVGGAELIYLTSRPVTMKEATVKWLKDNGLFFGDTIFKPLSLQFCKTTHFKASVFVGLERMAYRAIVFIDDEVSNCEAFDQLDIGWSYTNLDEFQAALG